MTQGKRVLVGRALAAYSALSIVFACAGLAFAFYWFPAGGWRGAPVTWGVVTVLWLGVTGRHALAWVQVPFMRRPVPVAPVEGLRVAVATAIVPSAEPLELLDKEFEAFDSVRYPHDAWVLDEEGDERVRALCEKHGAHYFTRANLPPYQTDEGPFQAHSKHGNYNAWLAEVGYARYDVLTQFDLDHVPAPEYLDRVLGYLRDPRVGFIACPPSYSNGRASFVARAATEENRRYHSTTLLVGFGMDFVLGNGSHMTHRLSALDAIGGIAAHQAEDTLTSLRYQAHGWRGIYVHEILARGLQPTSWKAYLNQHQRWSESDLDCRFRELPRGELAGSWTRNLQRRLFSLWYLQVGLQYVAVYALLVVSLVAREVPAPVAASFGAPGLVLLATLFACQEFRAQSFTARVFAAPSHTGSRRPGLAWRVAVLHFAKWPLILRAIRTAQRARVPASRTGTALTHKGKGRAEPHSLLPHGIAAAGVAAAYAAGVLRGGLPLALHAVAVVYLAAEIALITLPRLRGRLPEERGSGEVARTRPV